MKYLLFAILLFNYEGGKPFSRVILLLDYPKNDSFRINIYPLSGDNSFYIERVFDSKNYCIEKVYKKEVLVSMTKSWLYKWNHLWYSEESFFTNGKETEIRQRTDSVIDIGSKVYTVDDSLQFEIKYFPNGLISECGLVKDGCYYSNVYKFDTLNRTYWAGSCSLSWVVDTIEKIDEQSQLRELIASKTCKCDSSGTWRHINAVGRVLEEIEPKTIK